MLRLCNFENNGFFWGKNSLTILFSIMKLNFRNKIK